MAFSSVPTALFEVGKAIKKLLFATLVNNQNDLDTRVLAIEAGSGKISVFNDTVLLRQNTTTLTGLTFWEAENPFTLLEAKIGIFTKVSSGILEVDFQKSVDRNPSNFSSIFTTKPSINMATASNFDDSVNAVFNSGQTSVIKGDIFRFDVTSLPTGFGNFVIFLIGEFN